MRKIITLLVLVLMLFMVGCGSQEDDFTITEIEEPDDEVADVNETEEVNETIEEEPVEELNETEDVEINETEVVELETMEVITIFDFEPHPKELEIEVGTMVIWSNEDENFQHMIGWTKMDGKPGVIPPGVTWNYTFTQPGEYIWYSTPKPTVQGTITVTE